MASTAMFGIFPMHYLTLINKKAALEDGSAEWLDRLFLLEIVLIAWSYIECGSMYYMLCRTTQYHVNLTVLLKHLVAQYFVSMAARLVQIAKMYDMDADCNLREDWLFTAATVIRNWLTFIAFYFAPFAMLERTAATFYIQDYESNHRRGVGNMITLAMHFFAFTSALTFILELLPVHVHLASFVAANCIALLICLGNDRFNHNKFVELAGRETSSYSLSERYQVVENLKTAHLFKRGIVFIIVFSISCSSFISYEVMPDQTESLKNWLHVGFNYTALVYGIGLPFAMYYYNDQWKAEIVRIYRQVKHALMCTEPTTNYLRPLRNTMGEDMSPNRTAETDIYFRQLNKEWNLVSTNKAVRPI